MTKPIHIDKFPGMNNVDKQSQLRVVHNLNITEDQKLKQRDGFALWLALTGGHSLYSTGSEFFCVRQGTTTPERLCRISPDKAITHVCDIDGSGDPLFYVQVGTRLFISSKGWNGVYENSTVRAWGAEHSDDPADYAAINSSEELLMLGDIKAPFMENLALAGGRIFGTVGEKVYYNDPPLAYEMFRADTFHPFTAEITMVAVSNGGLYFGSDKAVWFAVGFDPAEWSFSRVSGGVIPGTLQYLEEYKGINNVPVWLDEYGVQVGLNGTVMPLTKKAIKIDHTAARAASLLASDGRYVSSMLAPPDASFGDLVTCEVVRNGKLIT